MLQRIQTIFLMIAVLAFGSLFYFPFASTETAYENFLSDKIYNLLDLPGLMVVVIVAIVITMLSILLFKNRGFQIKLAWLSIVFGIVIPVWAMLEFYLTTQEQGLEDIQYSLGAGIFIPIVIIVALILAVRNIKKDDKLVKSMDRLR